MVSKHRDNNTNLQPGANVQLSGENVQLSGANVQLSGANVQYPENNVQWENTASFQCDKCYKNYKNNRYLKLHNEKCTGITNPLQCHNCNEIFKNRSTKSMHLKKCLLQLSIPTTNQSNSGPQNIATLNNNGVIINNQNNNTNTINNTNITILAVDPNKLDQLEFVTDHITNPELKSILKLTHQDISNDKKINMLETYMRHLMTNPINKCIKKTNMQNVYSQIHTGNNKWETKHDRDLYPKLTCNVAQGFSGLMALRNSEKPMIKTERKLEELKAFLDYMSDEGYRNDSDPEINHQTHLAFKELVQRFKSVIFDVFKVNL